MAGFVHDRSLCHNTRAVRVYASAYGDTPTVDILVVDAVFRSDTQYQTDTTTLYHITAGVGDLEVPTGTWVSSATLQVTPYTSDEPMESVPEENTEVESAATRVDRQPVMVRAKKNIITSLFNTKKANNADAKSTLKSGDTVTTPDGTTVQLGDYNSDDMAEQLNGSYQNNGAGSTFTEEQVTEYMENYTTSSTTLMGASIGRMPFVHGMPFQYDYLTDRRLGTSSVVEGRSADRDVVSAHKSGGISYYGRSFAAEMAANLPIVTMAPGKPEFLTRVKTGSSAAASIKNEFFPLFGDNSAVTQEVQNNLADHSGDYDYYSIRINTTEYYKYVNSMCKLAASLMGLDTTAGGTIKGKAPTAVDWDTFNTSAEQDFSVVEEIMGLDAGVSFVYDPNGSVSDTISNSTGESQFSSMFNELSSTSRELDFILGAGGITWDPDTITGVEEAKSSISGGPFGIGNLVGNIATWMSNSAKGMNIRFPEIWNDSTFSRSYSIDMHFIAPYATAYCKWRYVIVPFLHIFALAAPVSDKNNSQYGAPFLVRVFSKGYFNVEMGIVESITWKRFGEGDMISEDGVPTQIDVSVQFKDMYHALAMTNTGDLGANTGNFLNNSGLMELIGTMSGINMNRRNPLDSMATFIYTCTQGFTGTLGNIKRSIQDSIRSACRTFFNWR